MLGHHKIGILASLFIAIVFSPFVFSNNSFEVSSALAATPEEIAASEGFQAIMANVPAENLAAFNGCLQNPPSGPSINEKPKEGLALFASYCYDLTVGELPDELVPGFKPPEGYVGGCGLNFGCYWKKLVATIAWIPSGPSAWLLTTVGQFFNYLVDHTIIDFKGTLEQMGESIDNAWTAFRDIANIVIIGMFVFIALSLILGLKEYGERKMIARVLIVAVLINFSLLFTKLIIDASHFTAYQFYNAAGNIGGPVADEARAAVDIEDETIPAAEPGIAGQFLAAMSITRVGEIHNILFQMQQNGNGMWNTILFGFFMGVMFLLAALVLLYGCFLLIARGLLLVFLMMTAPLAFASWLIPKFAGDGWSKWWDSLLRTAIFAPLLMIFLWASLTIATQINEAGEGLGALIDHPENGIGIGALFNYVFVLGLLFMSIKLASKFSGTIAGFSVAAMATAAPITLGSRALAAPLRGIGGKYATKYQESRMDQAKAARRNVGVATGLRTNALKAAHDFREAGLHGFADREQAEAKKQQKIAEEQKKIAAIKTKRAMRGATVAGNKMNLMNTETAKKVLGAVGVTGFMAGATPKEVQSYHGKIEERAKAAEKIASKLAPKQEEIDKARDLAGDRMKEQRKIEEAQLEATRRVAEEEANNTKALEYLPEQLETAIRESTRVKADAARNKTAIDASRRAGTISADEHQRQLRIENDRVKAADAAVKTVKDRIDVIDQPVKDIAKNIEKFRGETKGAIEKAKHEGGQAVVESGAGVAEVIGRRYGGTLTRIAGALTGANAHVAHETREMYLKNRGAMNKLKDILKGAGVTEGEAAHGGGSAPAGGGGGDHH